jgi:beta-glucosidase-like glycosyl hydrolase
MGLVDVPKAMAEEYNYSSEVPEFKVPNGADEYTDALTAAQESLVLLKNANNVLPLKFENLQYIILVGERGQLIDNVWTNLLTYDNIGV